MSSAEPGTSSAAQSGYVVLARKWRPQTFADLVGQDHVALTLANSIKMNRVAHAFLFTGVRGVGKTTSARILAKALNCVKGPTHTPCLECSPCREIGLGSDLDVLEMDAATRTGVDDVRQLQESLPYRPARDRFKVLIIDEVHMLSSSAWNALLKTLEEPPPHVKIIFATTEVGKIPVTILSRCQRYDFKLISAAMIAERLDVVVKAEGISAAAGATHLIAREAAGSMRDAMSLLDQVIAAAGPDEALSPAGVSKALGIAESSVHQRLVAGIIDRDPTACLSLVAELSDAGFDMAHVTRDVLSTLRDVVVMNVAPEARALVDVPDTELDDLRALANKADAGDLTRLYGALSKSAEEILRSPAIRASLEMALVRLATRPAMIPMDDLFRRLEGLERSLGPAGPGAPPRQRDPSQPERGRAPEGHRSGASREGRTPARANDEASADEPDPGPPNTQPSGLAPPVAPETVSAPAPAPRDPPRSNLVKVPYKVDSPPAFEFTMPESVRQRAEQVQREEEARETEAALAAAHPNEAPPPSARALEPAAAEPPASEPTNLRPSAPPVFDTSGAPRPVLDDPAHPAFADLERIVVALRPLSARVASVLERVAVVEIDDVVVRIGVEPRSFEQDTFSAAGALDAVLQATHAVLGPEAEVVLLELVGGREARTLAKNYDEAAQKRRQELDRSVREHPLVVALQQHLGAEIREVRIPDEGGTIDSRRR